ncbi:hypothetical protein TrVE_jg2417 [Triparma verrucosa]|uniref:AB hydrolase-1 domain-containing protein n=1 Tax=Triparma verrucosa TaxID=1606542 RepID=A0A9W7CHF1_9STRA|nr:hypothetical protein TrVE_jg2417 [Triparma verrucosa]
MNLNSMQAAPILVLHGGPGVPSHYLEPLIDVVPYRSIILHDQLGCGRSPGPSSLSEYSISKSVEDLESLLKSLGVQRFHLYGQSYGGILAFEFLKKIAEGRSSVEAECLSVLLSSSPSDVALVEGEANNLIAQLLQEDDDESSVMERFRLKHQCSTPAMPEPLKLAYNSAATPGMWRSTEVIKDYVAHPPMEGSKRMPSAMVMRGENDFVTEKCIQGWKDAFNHNFVRYKTLPGCSHHGLLENSKEYGRVVDEFFSEYD